MSEGGKKPNPTEDDKKPNTDDKKPNTDDKKPPTLLQEILDKFGSLITSAFGLVAALAWNEAIQSLFREFFGERQTFMPKLVYAIIVTILAVIFIFIVARAISKAKEQSSKLGL